MVKPVLLPSKHVVCEDQVAEAFLEGKKQLIEALRRVRSWESLRYWEGQKGYSGNNYIY